MLNKYPFIFDKNINIAIYPFGKKGKEIYELLKIERNNELDILVDNFYVGNETVINFSEVKEKAKYYWFLATTNMQLFVTMRHELVMSGVPQNQIIDPCNMGKEYETIIEKGNEKQSHYENIIRNIRMKNRRILRFGVYIAYDEENGADSIIELMKQSPDKWEYKIVVIPDIIRGKEYQIARYQKTYLAMVERYGINNVLHGYDCENDEYYDWAQEFDIVYCASPYDSMAHPFHRIEYLSQKDVLPIHIIYGFEGAKPPLIARAISKEGSYLWKYFTDTDYSLDIWKTYQPIRGRNVIVSGYPKMDTLFGKLNYNKLDNRRKKILITFHHSIDVKEFPLSNFLKYYIDFKELPNIFPNVTFVFRPHPLLFSKLVAYGYWTKEEVDDYIEDIVNKGMIYSTEGDYFHLFGECDAIINDCGSFTEEWLFTGKPGCFMKNSEFDINHMAAPLMVEALKHYEIAKDFDDIIAFIENIISDIYTVDISKWVKDRLMINYPCVAEYILRELDIYH